MLLASDVVAFRKLLYERGGDAVVHELIHDGTEREIPRPSDPDFQKEHYSGKKKKHTVKNAVITCMAGFILFTSLTVEGKFFQDTQSTFRRWAIPVSQHRMAAISHIR